SEIAKLTHAVNQQTSGVTTAMTAMLKQLQSNPPHAQVKAVEEICVTCGGAHLYYQCLAGGGNTFPEFKDNIQGYVLVAACNYNQGTPGYHPQGVANQMRPPELANCAICTPDGIARDVFVLVGKFTFPADFVVVDYESDPKVPLILGRPFLRTARALIDVHDEEMILRENSNLKDLIDQTDLANRDDLFVDPTPEMFTDEPAPDYSFLPRFDMYPDDFFEIESDADNFYDDTFDSKGEKIKEAELLID
nr:reverse transcriptase domain-containing protein [Tanacetum cinerariifolium]